VLEVSLSLIKVDNKPLRINYIWM